MQTTRIKIDAVKDTSDDFKKLISAGREEYFRAADSVLEKIRLQHGEGPEGFRNFLNSKRDVESVKPQKPLLN